MQALHFIAAIDTKQPDQHSAKTMHCHVNPMNTCAVAAVTSLGPVTYGGHGVIIGPKR